MNEFRCPQGLIGSCIFLISKLSGRNGNRLICSNNYYTNNDSQYSVKITYYSLQCAEVNPFNRKTCIDMERQCFRVFILHTQHETPIIIY